MRYVVAFGAFWYDFLIGDRPEVFAGSIIALAIAAIVVRLGLEAGVAGWLLALLILAVGGISLIAATRPRR
jgi:hypothetical protein